MTYDIIYSLTSHESIECVNDLVDNIQKTNRNINYLIINNTTIKNIHSLTKEHIIQISNKRKTFGGDIFNAHVCNYNFITSRGNLKFKLFIPITSNCYFIREITKSDIEEIMNKIENSNCDDVGYKGYHKNFTHWFYPQVNLSNDFIRLCENNNIEPTNFQHEGLILLPKQIEMIADFGNKHFTILTECTFPVEEIIFSSILKSYFGKYPFISICKIFWDKVNYNPSFIDIMKLLKSRNDIYIVKRINRNIKDNLRTRIRYMLERNIL